MVEEETKYRSNPEYSKLDMWLNVVARVTSILLFLGIGAIIAHFCMILLGLHDYFCYTVGFIFLSVVLVSTIPIVILSKKLRDLKDVLNDTDKYNL